MALTSVFGHQCFASFRPPASLKRTVIGALAVVMEEDQRTFLALQKPDINAIGQRWVRERGYPDNLPNIVAVSLAPVLGCSLTLCSNPNPHHCRDRWKLSF